MLDFVSIEEINTKKGICIYPEFIVKKSKDLMIRGKAFYAVWNDAIKMWTRNEDEIQIMVDKMVYDYADEHYPGIKVELKLLKNFSSNKWTEWQKYCKSLPDNFHELDENITFANTKIKKTDYVSRSLDYQLSDGEISAYDELMSTLYEPEEREKLEWAIGSVIFGDSKTLQKFVVLYGAHGTGKSTILNIIQELFPGYYSVFESRALSSNNNSFALESFRSNPLIAIQHDGDLSKIEDNTKLNSLISHEPMVVNEKFKSTYTSRFNSFLFMGTNKPVRITDAKSGIIRRLIDVTPSGNKIPRKRYNELMNEVKFELGAIAMHCLKVYENLGYGYYDNYIPTSMISSTNDFYNFIEDNYDLFARVSEDGIPLKTVWLRYKEYCEDAKVPYPFPMRIFKNELKNYFDDFKERVGDQRSVYIGFQKEKFQYKRSDESSKEDNRWLRFNSEVSLLDDILSNCPAQYAKKNGSSPKLSWDNCKTSLKDLDTSELHFVRPPLNHIVIDFDLKNENGEKDGDLNLEAAGKWPPTYAERSRSGTGIHLHYIYDGDNVEQLSRIYDTDIEVKVWTGKSSLRRALSVCNDIPIATISSGLPLKEGRCVIADQTIRSEKALRDLIARNLRKEIHGHTAPSVSFIYKILEDAYNSGLNYDVTDMRNDIQIFAMRSSHQAEACLRMVGNMKFRSEEPSEDTGFNNEAPIVFFDVEVFPNLFLIVWKKQGMGQKKVVMINPTPQEVETLFKFRLIGFNNRDYDNHMLYARAMGYSNEELFRLSQRIIVEKDRNAKFREAYNISYTDVYDFLSAGNKMSLKKWEIKLGLPHVELDLPWDKPVDKKLWKKVGDYCGNDVDATEAVFDENQSDWTARLILSVMSGLTPNHKTNTHTTQIIVGNDKNPQSKFIYPDLSKEFPGYEFDPYGIDKSRYNPGAKIVQGKSFYRGEDPGEGGYVYAQPGMYADVAVLDIESMHPNSAIQLKIFGEEYTMRLSTIVRARLLIKHKEYERAKEILPPEVAKYLDDPSKAKELANGLKTAINSIYGLTSAKFENKLRDPRNIDNVVAKRGALFMINLKHEVEDRGFTVVHIKTDSIKIAEATPDIIEFCKEYAQQYGYTFKHEHTYSKICLLNESTYIARVIEEDEEPLPPEKWYWEPKGTQMLHPYVFKTLFSKEPIEDKDLMETKSVTTQMYLDMNEKFEDSDEHDYHFIGKVGAFYPIKPGCGGGLLLRKDDNGKYGAVVGTKKPNGKEAYRWLEAELVERLDKWDDIDMSYYNYLVDEAVDDISNFGDFEWFVDDDSIEYEFVA